MYDFLTKMEVEDFVVIASSFLGAFFAFLFFLLGERILSKWKERKEIIEELKRIYEYVVDSLYYSVVNVNECDGILKATNPIVVTLNAFVPFPLGNGLYRSLGKFKVRESLVYFETSLRFCNIRMNKVGRYVDMLNDLSMDAMKNQIEDRYQVTMDVNQQKLKEDTETVRKHLEDIQKKREHLGAEIIFTLKLLQANWVKRVYVYGMLNISKTYRERQIQKILSGTNSPT